MADQPQTPSGGHPVAVLCARFGDRLDEVGDAAAMVLWSASDEDVVGLIRQSETQVRRLQAIQTAAVGEAARRDLAKSVGATSTVGWLADALTVRRTTAAGTDKLAGLLDRGLGRGRGTGLAATGAAFAAGTICADRARVVAEAVHALPDSLGPDIIGRGERLMLDWAGQHPAPVLAGLGRHLLAHLAPQAAEAAEADQLARAEARDADRANTFTSAIDHRGRVRVRGELDPESWALVSAALEPFAKPTSVLHPDGVKEPDRRTVGQRHADALVEVCRRSLAAGEMPTSFGFPAHIAVTIGFDQLGAAVGAGTLDTGTPITAEDVRRMGCDATLIPVLLNTDGVPLDVGRAVRVYTKELRRAVEVRDIGCAFPGCTRPASWTNVHHILHWIYGGPTSLDNGVLLCGAHHRLIHRGEWTVRLGTDRRPEFLPPPWVDPDRQPRRNTAHLRC